MSQDNASKAMKPKLLPTLVPWVISPSAPYLTPRLGTESSPASATFIAYFRNSDRGGKRVLQYVPEPAAFRPGNEEDLGPYRLVRVTFQNAVKMDQYPAFSDNEVIQETQFDWSEIPGARLPGEAIEKTVARRAEWWLKTNTSPDARIYEVEDSGTSKVSGRDGLKRYILCGHDNYLEVLADGWTWEVGQVVA